MTPNSLGQQIRKARRKAGYRNCELLAVELGVGARTVQRWETGQSEPSLRQVQRIAVLTSEPLSYFLAEEVAA